MVHVLVNKGDDDAKDWLGYRGIFMAQKTL